MALASIRRNSFLVLGRAGMDLYADPPGTQAQHADRFFACLGGSAGNVAAGIARLGGQASLVTAVSDDSVGRFTLNELRRYGVDISNIAVVGDGLRTSLAVVETRLEDFQSVIYRNGAADLSVTPDQSRSIRYDRYGALIMAGTVLASEPARSATFAAIDLARQADLAVIFDIDDRPYTWASADDAAATYAKAARLSDIVIGNDQEFAVMAGPAGDGLQCAVDLVRTTAEVVVFKRGQDGARTFTKDGTFESGVFPVKALKPVGAGDAFMAGFVTALASGISVEAAVTRGSAAAAIVVSGIGCAPAMPTPTKLADFLAHHPGPSAP